MTKVAINGFGRIGRNTFKAALERNARFEIVALNDLTDTSTLAHLLKYDTVYGRFSGEISSDEQNLIVNGKKYRVYAEKDPSLLPWKDLGVDIVLECTGRFTDGAKARAHLAAGAKKVIISAPAKGEYDGTFLIGVNADKYKDGQVISNASCTTNCTGPVIAVLQNVFGIEKALMTTIHSVTAEQNLVDGPPPGLKKGDLRRARAAGHNIIPTTTGAAKATTEAVTELKNLFDGISIRVPTIDVSLIDVVAVLKKNTTEEELNKAFIDASKNPIYQNTLSVTNEPLVSSDFIKDSASAIVDLSMTKVIGGNLVKVLAWYDNEWGYSCRLVELAEQVGEKL